ncbi:ATP-binding cassette domain-containing protein [Schleiferilactobacillus shenzhenensis]|uniref:Uup n=1 Tax=Schleiferilactobacillus shenzhenensis LY-73 TaxID=1231336 RepID=U4TJT7_9LACO|nr:ATP-binding cassette domain-containing protein [Schleiferilactobacillus shenzhenensis]ERL65101.1 Uup [Schleiferilactobacillus shenzhenensis LY-73]
MLAIQINQLTYQFPDAAEPLFSLPHLTVNSRERVAIIGPNGTGKSTLLKLLAANADSRITEHGKIGYVPQLKDFSSESGGEQVKREIFDALGEQPEILLLDEPSANLDLLNQHWLARELGRFAGTLVVVSHDETLLAQPFDQIVVFGGPTVTVFTGDYAAYRQAEATKAAHAEAAYHDYVEKKKALEVQVQKRLQQAHRLKKGNTRKLSASDRKSFGMTSHDKLEKKKASTAMALARRIDRMVPPDRVEKEAPLHFQDLNAPQLAGHTMLRVNGWTVMRGKKMLIQNIQLKIPAGQRVAITGPNQAGKTSFFQDVLSRPDHGVWWNPLTRVGYFAQDLDTLDRQQTVMQNVAGHSYQDVHLIRNLLAGLGFPPAQWDQSAGTLSGGEQVKVNLARVLVGDYNLLMLDEPTNYLDLNAIEALAAFLENYPGTLLLISHDQAFVKRVAQQTYTIRDQRLVDPARTAPVHLTDEKKLLLQHQIDTLVMDPDADIAEIRALRRQLADR